MREAKGREFKGPEIPFVLNQLHNEMTTDIRVNLDDVTAHFKDSLLEIRIPKKAETRKIQTVPVGE